MFFVIASYALTAVLMLFLSFYSSYSFIKNPVPTFIWLGITAITIFLAALFEIVSILSDSASYSNLFIRLAYESFVLMIVFLIFFSESYTFFC